MLSWEAHGRFPICPSECLKSFFWDSLFWEKGGRRCFKPLPPQTMGPLARGAVHRFESVAQSGIVQAGLVWFIPPAPLRRNACPGTARCSRQSKGIAPFTRYPPYPLWTTGAMRLPRASASALSSRKRSATPLNWQSTNRRCNRGYAGSNRPLARTAWAPPCCNWVQLFPAVRGRLWQTF